MADLYQNIPELQTQAQANEQKRRIAEAMMAQGLEQQLPYSSSGRYVVPMSWTQGLNKVAQALLGAYGTRKAQQSDDALAAKLTEGQRKAYEAYTQGLAAPKAMTPAALRPEGVSLAQTQQPQVGTMQSLTQQTEPTPQVAPATQPTEQDAGANDEASLANLERFIGNPYANPQQVQAALGIETLRGARADRADARAVSRENALLAAQTRLMDIEARLQDRALTRQQQVDLARQANELRAQIAADANATRLQIADLTHPSKGTAGEVALDKAYATDYAKYVNGGAATAQQALDELRGASKALDTTQASGPVVGAEPMWVRKRLHGPGVAIQQDIERNIQSSLREVLGAQYTQIEGENLLQRTFDPAQPESVNKERLNSLITRLERAKQEKDRAAEYFRDNGTLVGFQGKTDWTVGDFKPPNEESPSPAAEASGKTVVRRGTEKGTNRVVIQYSDGTTAYGN